MKKEINTQKQRQQTLSRGRRIERERERERFLSIARNQGKKWGIRPQPLPNFFKSFQFSSFYLTFYRLRAFSFINCLIFLLLGLICVLFFHFDKEIGD